MKDYYTILGVSKNASKEEIKKSFRKLAHQYHPDKKGGDEKKFKEINEAYQVLSNDSKRAQYDQFGQTFGEGTGSGQGFSGFDFGGFDFSGFSKGSRPGGFEFDLNDIFSDFFRGTRARTSTRIKPKGSDIEADIEISLEEAFLGIEKQISLRKYVKCAKCGGHRNEPGTNLKTCPKCNGTGEVRREQRTVFGVFAQVSDCSECSSEGKIPEVKCSGCKGFGMIYKVDVVNVRVPAGVRSGQVFEFVGAGEMGRGGAGNLYVRVLVKEHSYLERQGDDIFSDVEISVSQAVLGDTIRVGTIDGEYAAKIPSGFQSGGMIKLVNKGMPKMNKSGRGDHYLRITVKIPEKLSKRAKELFEDLRNERV